MISTELYARLRQCKAQGVSMRQTAKLLQMSRKTVKRYWDGAHTPDEKKAYPEHIENSNKEEVMAALIKYFEENKPLSMGKQTVNAKTAWESLRETFTVGESTVRRYVRELKEKHPEGFIPLSFEPGEVMQVDWCEIKVNIKGQIYKTPLFCAVLPYSYAIFAMVMPDMKMPRLVEGLREAFGAFEGVSERVFFDNMRAAVLKGAGANAIMQKSFRLVEAHYAFEAVFMNAGAGNEKGAVENLCGLIRQVACTPMPKGQNLKEIQDHIAQKCLDYIRFHKIRARREAIAPMFEQEKAFLRPLPVKPLDAYADTEAVVQSDLTFRYDATKYSVPLVYVGKRVTVRASCYRIEAWYKGECIASHIRPFVSGDHQYDPEHYLDLLVKRPRAVGNAAPLKYGTMPPELMKFRENCRGKDKYEQLVEVLLLGRQVDADILLKAVDYANKTGSPNLRAVKFYLDIHQFAANEISDPIAIDPPSLDVYDILIRKGAHDND